MNDIYHDRVLSVDAPARRAIAVTPSDTVDLAAVPRALWVGTDGDVAVIMADDAAAVTFKNVHGGISLMVSRVLATGTTATDIVAVY